MQIGTSFSALAMITNLVITVGCGVGDAGFESDPYSVGDEGNLRFWITEGCGFDRTCSPEVGLPLNADDLRLSTRVGVVAHTPDITELPQLVFVASRDGIFSVRDTWCKSVTHGPDDPFLPCPVESPRIYSVELELHSEGRADLVAHLADDDSLFDRGTVRVRPPR
jgi:hypothetical protein